MKNHSYNYFHLCTIHTNNCFEFTCLDDLSAFIKYHQLKEVFVLLNEQNEPTYFGIIHNNVLFRHSTLGFKTLEDYHSSVEYQFPDAAIFYEATAEGYKKYEDYDLVRQAGIANKEIFEKMKAANFIEGFKDYYELIQPQVELPHTMQPANAYELYKLASENGFENYQSFRQASLKGFADADTYAIATQQDFPTCADYNEALQKGFRNFKELELAREKKARDRDDFSRMYDLESVQCNACTHDKKVLLILLSKLEQGKKISINKLKDLFKKSVEEYRYPDTLEMPLWFSASLESDEALIAFLSKDDAKQYGHYDTDGEFFEINRMQDRKVVIDGSNVAYNSNGNGNTNPCVSNIIKMISFLKSKGFTEITVINDASLKHKLTDADKLSELKQSADFLEAPKESPADIFIIKYVKRHNCLLVSNDTFREWKVQDPWIANNIDFYRLAFMIKDEDVLMPDLN